MSVKGLTALTLADWGKRVDPNGKVDKIIELLGQTNPILQDMPFVEGNLPTGHRTTIRSGLPSATWRLLNYGVQPSKSTTVQVTDSVGMLETYAEVDKSLADLNGNTAEFRLSEDRAFIEAMNQQMAQTLFYGDSSVNPQQFMGLSSRYSSLSAGNAQNIIDAGGTLSKSEMRKMAQVGINEDVLRRIGEQFGKHGEDMDGLLTGHSHLWDDRFAREIFQSAVLKDVDSVIVTPGVGDTPLFFSKEGWKMITQFKTFIFAQHNRVLVSGIQQGDAAFYLGALGTIALGSMVYMMKQKLSGRDIDYSWNNLVKEGIDRGGMLGWLSEPLNTVENISGGRFGLGAMFGAPPVSRFQSRNAIGALLGPTFDLGGDAATVANGVLNGEFDSQQTHAVRKMLPFQNLWAISPLLNKVEEQMK